MKNFACLLNTYPHGGSITCSFSNRRCYSADLEQGGLEILCKIKFLTSNSVEKEKAEKLVIAALSNFDGEDFGDTMQFCQICQNFPSSELYYGSRLDTLNVNP